MSCPDLIPHLQIVRQQILIMDIVIIPVIQGQSMVVMKAIIPLIPMNMMTRVMNIMKTIHQESTDSTDIMSVGLAITTLVTREDLGITVGHSGQA